MASLFGRNALKARASEISTDDILEHVALVQTWLDDYEIGTLKKDKETSREQQYNSDFFVKILGYVSKPASPYTFDPKDTTEKGQYPDAVVRYTELGDSPIDNVSAVVELKGASIPLDKPQKREGNLSPVQQAFKYKPQYRVCPFVIVSNFFEFRLYNDNQLDYERWTLRDLVDPTDDYLAFKQWYFLLKADNFVSATGKSNTEKLLSDIRQEQIEVGEQFYAEYREIRLELLRDIWRNNPSHRSNFQVALQKAQTIIDRVVFVCFAEDSGLLPDDTLARTLNTAEKSNFESIWGVFKAFFNSLDQGSSKLGIPTGYGGALFRNDDVLNDLDISDNAIRELVKLGSKYDFKDDLTVTVLGHIFEQSITDLEAIRDKVEQGEFGTEAQKPSLVGRRKREGVFYTPEYVVRYIVDRTVGKYLREVEERLMSEQNLAGMKSDVGYETAERRVYTEYQIYLQKIRVIDPACGSGAFLVGVFDYLLAENLRVDAILGGAVTSHEDVVRSILTDNIYGVDLNEESVEITKLSLWLKTATKDKPLTALDGNIKSGNSLVSNVAVTDRAFDFHAAFPRVFAPKSDDDVEYYSPGFDVVVGNPPYVSANFMSKNFPEVLRKDMKKNYVTAKGAVDLYIYFFEQGMNLLHDNGKLGYITPNRYVSVSYGTALRTWLIQNHRFDSILNCSDTRVFEDADTYPVVTVLSKGKAEANYKVRAGRLEERQPSGAWILHDSSKLTTLPENIIGFLLNDKLPITEKVFSKSQLLTDVGAINATSTAGEAEEYALFVDEVSGHRIINTGTIDPYQTLWGKKVFKKRGKKFLKPLLDLDEVTANRRTLYETEKIILAKLGLRAEAFYDGAGEYASIDTNCIHSFSEDYQPEYVLCWLNSRLYNFVFECLFDGARMSGGYMGYSSPSLRCTPIKKIPVDDQQKFVDIARELTELYKKKDDADHKFRSIVTTAVDIRSWPGTNSEWWELDAKTFIGNFKKKFNTSEVEDLMDVHDKHKSKVKKLAHRINMLTHRADLRFYELFALTRKEVGTVEAMEFAV